MTDTALILGFLFIVLPACLGWAVLILSAIGTWHSLRQERERERTIAGYNAMLVQAQIDHHRTAYTRKRELRLVTRGNAEIVTLHSDGPRAA